MFQHLVKHDLTIWVHGLSPLARPSSRGTKRSATSGLHKCRFGVAQMENNGTRFSSASMFGERHFAPKLSVG